MTSFWNQMPFVRLIVPFLGGILLREVVALTLSESLVLLTIPATAWWVERQLRKKVNRYLVEGFLICTAFVFGGFLTASIHRESQVQRAFTENNHPFLLLELTTPLQRSKSGWKAETQVLAGIDTNLQPTSCRGKLLVYFSATHPDSLPGYGNRLLVKSGFQEISPPRNPGGFDYRKYLFRKGIMYQQYLKNSDWKVLPDGGGNKLVKQAIDLQENIVSILRRYQKNPEHIAVAQALLYGYDDDISEETTQAFGKTGTLHVLAVSGMHVGLLFLLLSTLLKPLEKNQKSKRISALIQVFAIWAYSLLCGMSPSILRASVMFTFVLLGKQLRRSGNAFNSLSASAFFLLLFDPMLLFHAGFLLSYAAVGGILAFYLPLYHLITFRYRILDEIWKVIAVSMSAQSFTLPLSICFFHQFPNYFLPANLLIIPLTTLIIYLGLLLLAFSSWPFAAIWIGKGMSLLTTFTVNTAYFLGNLPGSTWEELNWSVLAVMGYFLFWILLTQFIRRREPLFMQLMLVLVLVLQLNSLRNKWKVNQENELVVYRTRNGPALAFIFKGTATLICPSGDTTDNDEFKKIFRDHRIATGIQKHMIRNLHLQNAILNLPGNSQLGVVSSELGPSRGPDRRYFLGSEVPTLNPGRLRLLMIYGEGFLDLEYILKQYQVEQIVLNYPMRPGKRQAMKRIANSYRVPVYDIGESGAYEVSL